MMPDTHTLELLEAEIDEPCDADYEAAVEAMEAAFQATAAREQAFSRWLNKF